MTILSPIIFVALFALVAYLSQLNNSKERTISVLDESGQLDVVFENKDNIKYNLLTNITLDEAKKMVEENEEYGLLHIERHSNLEAVANSIKFYSEDSPSLPLIGSLESKLEKRLTDLKLQQEGVDLEKLRASETKIDILQESFLGEKTSKIDNILKLAFGGFAGYMLFMFIIIYGNMIMRSVIEEKTSRIIEVIISSVRPMQLLMGKIIGTSLAGLTQFAIWVFLGGILMLIIPPIFGFEMSQIQSQ
jgi:ABC-2 type transport system permease protein